MQQLLEPTSSLAVILGAHDWSKAGLSKANSFRRSAAHFHRYLLAEPPYGLGLEPDFVLSLFDDPSPASAQLVRLRDTIKGLVREHRDNEHPIKDVLIYYVGHGTCESGKQLHLLVRDSSEGIEEQSSIGASDLAQVLRVAAPQQRRLVILDCCFSEAAAEAFGAMGALDEAVALTALKDLAPPNPPPERGTLLFCSSPRRSVSIGAPNSERTLFTGALLAVLKEGLSTCRSEMLSFADLRSCVFDRMLKDYDGEPPRPALHQPEQQHGDLTICPAFPNAALRHIRPKVAQQAEDEARQARELAARQQAEDEARQARELAARQQAEDEARQARELAARQQAEDEARRALRELVTRQAEDEVRQMRELAARQQAEDEARQARELVTRQAEDEVRQMREQAARQQAEEKISNNNDQKFTNTTHASEQEGKKENSVKAISSDHYSDFAKDYYDNTIEPESPTRRSRPIWNEFEEEGLDLDLFMKIAFGLFIVFVIIVVSMGR